MNRAIRKILSLTLMLVLIVSYLSYDRSVGRAAETLALGTDSKAKWLTLDGVAVPGTQVYKDYYEITIPWNYPKGLYELQLDAVLNDPKATITDRRNIGRPTKANGDRDWLLTLDIISEDGRNETRYKLYIIKEADPANLADIKVNGNSVNGFGKYTTNYSYELPFETVDLNVVTATPYNPAATVTVTPPAILPGNAVIQVTNGAAEKTYTVSLTRGLEFPEKDVELTSFSVWYEGEIVGDGDGYLGGRDVRPNEGEREFTFIVPSGTLKAYAEGFWPRTRGATVVTVPGTKYIVPDYNARKMDSVISTVTSSDGSVTAEYIVNFTDGNSELEAIYENDILIEGFASNTLEYTRYIEAYDGIPTVTARTKRATAVLEKSETSNPTYPAIVELNAKQLTREGTIHSQNIYRVRYQRYANNYLTDIKVNGQPIDGFDKFTNTYDVVLPYGTTINPSIEVTKADGSATTSINGGDRVDSSRTIVVRGSDGRERTYTINFRIAPSTSAMLNDLRVGVKSLEDFDPSVLRYTYYIPYEATELPIISWDQGDDQQIVTYDEPVLIKGQGATGNIRVLAGDEVTETTYKIEFKRYPPLRDLLSVSSIKVGEKIIANFSPYKKEYLVVVPYKTDDLPVISAEERYPEFTELVVEQGTLEPEIKAAKVKVKAVQTTSSQVYFINFKREEADKDATLKSINIGKQSLANFDKSKYDYQYPVSYDASSLPEVSAAATSVKAVVSIKAPSFKADGIDPAVITVTAEDGLTVKEYRINFTRELPPPLPGTDATVKYIKVDGMDITDFDASKVSYNYPPLAYDATVAPVVTAATTDGNATLEITQAVLNDPSKSAAVIKVTAEDEVTIKEYRITFTKNLPPVILPVPPTDPTPVEDNDSSTTSKTTLTDSQKEEEMKKDLEGYVDNLIDQGKDTKSSKVAKETVKDMIKVIEYTNEMTEQKDPEAGKDGKTNTEIVIDLIEQAEHPISKITDEKDIITLTEGILEQVNVYQDNHQEDKELEKLRLELSSVDLAKRAISTVSTHKLSKEDLAVESDRVSIYVQDKQIEKIAKKKEDSVKKLEDEVEAIAKGKTYELEAVPLVVSAPPLAKRIEGVDVTVKEDLINNHSVKVETDLCSFTLDNEVFGNSKKSGQDNNETITLSQTKLKKKPKEMKDIEVIDTPVMDFTAVKGETKMEIFEEPLTTSFKVDKTLYKDYTEEQLESLTVFYYNEKTEEWEPVGGRFDPVSETITTSLPHFSQYTVMLSNKSFSDVNQHWARKEINIMLRKGIIDEKADFSPIQKISRAEFSSWVSKAFNIDGQSIELPFEDIAPEDQYYKEIAAAYKKEIIKGKSETIFDSKGFISREEIAALVTRALSRYKDMPISENVQEILGSFIDREKIAQWAEKGVATAITEKLIYGYPNKSYRPQKDTQKDEAAVLIYNIYYR